MRFERQKCLLKVGWKSINRSNVTFYRFSPKNVGLKIFSETYFIQHRFSLFFEKLQFLSSFVVVQTDPTFHPTSKISYVGWNFGLVCARLFTQDTFSSYSAIAWTLKHQNNVYAKFLKWEIMSLEFLNYKIFGLLKIKPAQGIYGTSNKQSKTFPGHFHSSKKVILWLKRTLILRLCFFSLNLLKKLCL